jgi:hypothetical protein
VNKLTPAEIDDIVLRSLRTTQVAFSVENMCIFLQVPANLLHRSCRRLLHQVYLEEYQRAPDDPFTYYRLSPMAKENIRLYNSPKAPPI